MKRVAVITPYVPPNIIALYKLFIEKSANKDIQLKIFCVKKIPVHRNHEIPNYDGLDISFFDGINYYFPKSEIAVDFPKGLVKSLKKYQPNNIIFDGYGVGFIGAIFYAIRRKIFKKDIRLIFWNSNTSKNSGPFESSKRVDKIFIAFFLRRIKIILLNFFDSFGAGGKSMFEYLTDLGINESTITLIPRATFTKQEILKQNLSLPKIDRSKVSFIFCGEISKRKGVDIIFDAMSLNDPNFNKQIKFDIYGNYKESEKDFFIEKFSTSKSINFQGWLEPELLTQKLKEFDVLILPSRREPFGRIAIEALSSGLYVVTQNSVGASKDIDENYLGATFSENSYSELNKLIKDTVTRIEQIRSLREKRIEWVAKNWTHDVSADGLLKIIQDEK